MRDINKMIREEIGKEYDDMTHMSLRGKHGAVKVMYMTRKKAYVMMMKQGTSIANCYMRQLKRELGRCVEKLAYLQMRLDNMTVEEREKCESVLGKQ